MNRIQPPNSPPQTTHLVVNSSEVLHRPSLYVARYLKDKDRQVPWAPGLFSRKQLTTAMCLGPRKQKPLSDALDGLYLLCKEHMQWTQWEGGHAGTLWRQASSWSESHQGLDYIHVVLSLLIMTEWQPLTSSLSLQLYRINQDKSKPQNIYKTTIKDALLKFGKK